MVSHLTREGSQVGQARVGLGKPLLAEGLLILPMLGIRFNEDVFQHLLGTVRKRTSLRQLCYNWILLLNVIDISWSTSTQKTPREMELNLGSLRYHNHLLYLFTTLLIIITAIYLFSLLGVSQQVLSFPAKVCSSVSPGALEKFGGTMNSQFAEFSGRKPEDNQSSSSLHIWTQYSVLSMVNCASQNKMKTLSGGTGDKLCFRVSPGSWKAFWVSHIVKIQA